MAEQSDKALEEIKREVIEGRNLVIKTDNQLKTLHAELKLVGKRQEDFQRRQWISSAVAYAVFAALCVAGAIAVSNARTASAGADKDRLEKQAKDLQATIDQLKAADAALATNERIASDTYKLMSQGQGEDRLKGIEALNRIEPGKLSSFAKLVLNDRAVLLRKEVGSAFLERGKAAFRRQDYPTAANELNRFMTMNPVEDDAAEASYFLGNALIQTKKADEAVPHLQRFIGYDKKAKNRDFAMLMLVQAYDATGQRDKAIELAREAIGAYPASEFAGSFRSRLSRKEPAAAAPAPAAAEPAPAPAPAVAPNRQPLKPATN